MKLIDDENKKVLAELKAKEIANLALLK